MAEPKLTDEDIEKIVERYVLGHDVRVLASDFSVGVSTIKDALIQKGVRRPSGPKPKSRDMAEFASRAKSVLWRQNRGADKKIYNQWKARVEELESKEGANYTHDQAVVRASKEFPCLTKLFREYDVKDFDPNPESHPQIQHYGKQPDNGQVICENTQQSYRDSLRWAIEAAGRHLRTGEIPKSCPCDAAWYLYRQAIEEPKDFLGKVGQIESKVDTEADGRRSSNKAGKRSIAEIDAMLAVINESLGEENDA